MGLFDAILRRGAKAPARPKDDELFDDEFQKKLDVLSLVSRRVFSGRSRAERRTKKSGSGVEFKDHRDYVEGDDLRYLDWSIYQRFGKLQTRLYEEEEDLSVYVLLDTSTSMGFGAGEKLRQGKRIAAALAYVALANLDRVGVLAVRDAVNRTMQPTRGKQRIFRVFEFLRPLAADGVTELGPALRAFAAQQKRRGLAVLVSDLYDPRGFEEGINALRYAKFEVLVIHLKDAREAKPTLHGDVRLYDCETGEEREVTVTPKVLARFAEAYAAYGDDIAKFCKSKQVTYVAADVAVPFDELVLRVFRSGGFLR